MLAIVNFPVRAGPRIVSFFFLGGGGVGGMGALFFVPAGLGVGLVGGRTKKAAGKASRFLLVFGLRGGFGGEFLFLRGFPEDRGNLGLATFCDTDGNATQTCHAILYGKQW